MKVAFITLGCKVNKYETDLLKEKCEKAGHVVVSQKDIADLYVINSCSVTNMSDRKTRQMVAKAKSINNKAKIAVIGCSVESNKENINSFKEVDYLIGNEDKMELFNIINTNKNMFKLQDVSKVKTYKKVGILEHGTDIREQIKIEDGCNNFCSYCVIPYTRGRVRSRQIEEIEEEAKNLVKNNVKEIVLVGIEVASYGKDLENINLLDVILKLEKIEGVERIRLSSIDPRFLNEENIIKLSKFKKLCPHFHVSMQSGCNETLKRMNRHYTKEQLIQVCNNLNKHFVNPYIAVDVIVGFPQETDDEFNETIETIKKMNLSEIHVFKYSKRNYTKAATMEGQVRGEIKNKRSKELLELSKNLNKRFLEKYIGKKVSVLFENYVDGVLLGITPNYIKLKVKGESVLCGTIQDVVVISLEKDMLLGSLD